MNDPRKKISSGPDVNGSQLLTSPVAKALPRLNDPASGDRPPESTTAKNQSVSHLVEKAANSRALLLLIGIVCLASRLALMSYESFGPDTDAWRLVRTGLRIHETHTYSASRYPGFPLVELTLGLLGSQSPALLNGLTALISTAAVILFALILIDLNVRHWVLFSISFSFTPVVFAASIVPLDYMWSLAAILGSLLALMKGRVSLAGILLGLAIASRLTAGLMWLPFAILLGATASPTGRQYYTLLFRFSLIAAAVALLFYLPALLENNLSYLRRLSVMASHPAWSTVLYRATAGVWGLLGLAGVTVGFGAFLVGMRSGVARNWTNAHKATIFCAAAAVSLYALAFVRMPETPGYLIPVVPLLLLVLAVSLRGSIAYVVSGLVIVSGFVLGFADVEKSGLLSSSPKLELELSGKPWAVCLFTGDLIMEKEETRHGSEGLDSLLRLTTALPPGSRIVAGALSTMLELRVRRAGIPVDVADRMTEDDIDRLVSRQTSVFFIQGFEPRALVDSRIRHHVSLIETDPGLREKLGSFE